MNWIKQLRQHFNLTQQQLADLLGITRSFLAYTETGKRTLPAPALTRLTEIELLRINGTIPSLSAQQNAAAKTELGAWQKQLQKCIKANEYQKQKLARELEQAEFQYTQLLHCGQLLQHLLKNPSAKDRKWIELMQLELSDQFKQCSPAVQAALRFQISCLEGENVQAQKAMEQAEVL